MPSPRISKEERERSLKYSKIEGAAYAAVVGLGENFLSPFALALGANNLFIGLLSAIPHLVGSLSQLLGAWLVARLPSRKPFIVLGALVQAPVWLAVLLIPFLGLPLEWALGLLLLLVSLHWFFGSVIHPAWASLIGDLVPSNKRGSFFGSRNSFTGLASLGSMVLGGWLLGVAAGNIFIGFAALFALVLVARLTSVYFLSRHAEPEWKPNHHPTINVIEFTKRAWGTNFGKLTLYAILFLFVVNIAAPFFVVYMLRDLGYSYFTYGILVALELLARVLSMPYWGKLADQYGNRAVLAVGGTLVPFVPLLWLLSPNPMWIALAGVFSGFVWAAFDLAVFDYLMDASNKKNRPEYFAHFALFNNLSIALGAAVGGFLSQALSETIFLGMVGLPLVLLVSGILRLAVTATLLPRVREVKPREEPPKEFLFEAAALQPARIVFARMLQTSQVLFFLERTVVEKASRVVRR